MQYFGGRNLFLGFLFFFASCRVTSFYTDKKFFITKEQHTGFFPAAVSESSGLESAEDSLITFNDSGGETSLYLFSPLTPEIHGILKIPGIYNIDWEDIARDEDYLYIGDFGNNFGDRDTLIIYKCPVSALGQKDPIPQKISFTYHEKGPEYSNIQWNTFDCEAMCMINDSLWLFTKNWSDKSSSVYKIPVEPGHYELTADTILKPGMLVTGADYYPENNLILLIGYKNYIPRIRAYSYAQYKLTELFKIHFFNRFGLQTEGIVIANGELIYFSNEKSLKKQGLFQFSVVEKKERNR